MFLVDLQPSWAGLFSSVLFPGAFMTFVFGYIHLNWKVVGEMVLFVVSLVDGLILMTMATTDSITVAYVGYWGYKIFFHFLIAVASCEIASNIRNDSYGLAFGINTFVSLVLQALLTAVVVDKAGLGLDPRSQVRHET